MRLSRRMGIYASGNQKVTVSVYGAISETVTITNGTDTYTVTTNANGVGTTTPEVKLGTYTVTGTISVGALPSGRSVTVDKNTTVITAYPAGALFWYGNGDAQGDSLWSKLGGWTHYGGYVPSGGNGAAGSSSQSSSERGFGVSCSCQNSPTYYGGTSFSNNAVSLAGYSTIHAIASGDTNNASFGWGCPSGRDTRWDTSIFSTGSAAKAIPSGRTTGYLALTAYNCRFANYVYGYAGITASAIWLE